MSFIFCTESLIVGETAEISGRAAQHLRARRARVGELIELQTEEGERFVVEIVSAGRVYEVIPRERVPLRGAPRRTVTLVQPLIQEQALDMVLQKTTELGVAQIRIYEADHSPHALKKERVEHKLSRWRDIVLSACEQSGRATPPTVLLYATLAEALVDAPHPHVVGAEEGHAPKDMQPDTCSYVVGPEGGLSDDEKHLLANAEHLCFGNYTLRSETAAIVGVAQLLLR
jgi:16S rRNA (uracil1498-N3)-methyltransferase